MLKKWFAEVLAYIICASSITPLHGEEPLSVKQFHVQIEEDYRNEKYSPFLEELHQKYQRAGKSGVVGEIYQKAKSAVEKAPALEKNVDPKLVQERNTRLLDAISEYPNLEISRKIDTVVFSSPSEEQKEILADFNQLKFKKLEDAKGTIENKVAALEIEYYIKSLLLDTSYLRSSLPLDHLQDKKVALLFEKFDKMEKAAREAEDPYWIKKVQLGKIATLVQREYDADYNSLEKLGQGKVDPKNRVEEKVKQIMMDYLAQIKG